MSTMPPSVEPSVFSRWLEICLRRPSHFSCLRCVRSRNPSAVAISVFFRSPLPRPRDNTFVTTLRLLPRPLISRGRLRPSWRSMCWHNVPGLLVSLSGINALLPLVRRILEAQAVQGTGAEAKSKGEGDFMLLLLLLRCYCFNLVVACGWKR